MSDLTSEKIRRSVRDTYAAAAKAASQSCCAPRGSAESCCGPTEMSAETRSRGVGYGAEDLAAAPEGSNMGLGCGNPTAIAALKPGETVLDLGSGGGFDCFLAARQVGSEGRVIGIDMTPEMIEKARANAAKVEVANVEFRLGEIEHLPVADSSVDVVMSNCVINLSADKPAVYREIFRALKPGGRIAISDMVALAPLPEELATDLKMVASCIGGAAMVVEISTWLEEIGFAAINVDINEGVAEAIEDWAPGRRANDYVAATNIEAIKP
ncbi:MAG TPA: arsenite methyltransferase [Alphaproteobacteria bacterium]|nr:arsenite methyltransferase [Alphaproteobacteria bacterium]